MSREEPPQPLPRNARRHPPRGLGYTPSQIPTGNTKPSLLEARGLDSGRTRRGKQIQVPSSLGLSFQICNVRGSKSTMTKTVATGHPWLMKSRGKAREMGNPLSSATLATFQGLSGHMWLTGTILDAVDFDCLHYHREFPWASLL